MNIKILPKIISKVGVPPIKCQGIKTKLVPFILSNISWQGHGRWVEPFLGSGVVLFNVMPEKAFISDSNIHIINLYKGIQSKKITPELVRQHLEYEGHNLQKEGEEYFYSVRERFNKDSNPLDLLFLNRSCFNGVMRFNKKGGFNVPFCKKIDRFSKAYVTKIVNQTKWIASVINNRDWVFTTLDWQMTLAECKKNDFVYMDPPYIGRHTDYFNSWTEGHAEELARMARKLPCGFALSMWKENIYRKNLHLEEHWAGLIERNFNHFYHIGSTENLRHSMEESLIIKPGFETNLPEYQEHNTKKQLSFV